MSSIPLFFLKDQILEHEREQTFVLQLSPDDLHHANVLRLRPGESIAVCDGEKNYYSCEVVCIDKNSLIVSIRSRGEDVDCANVVGNVTLFQGLPKGDKLDTIVKQGTEIGISAFVPFVSDRSISRPDASKIINKTERLNAIAKSAAMQSGRREIPVVYGICSEKEAVDRLEEFDAVIVFWEECDPKLTLHEAINDELSRHSDTLEVAVVVGPEGGFNKSEIELFRYYNENTNICSLGNTILRTETAAIVGSSLVLYELGGLGNSSANVAECNLSI